MLNGNEVIYQIFVRNYSKEGTFDKVTDDLERIKDLGVDILYLMPINEIGEKERKGTYGSPYASKDYFSISPDLGKIENLRNLIEKTHKLGMKIILDMVFNHTAPDSKLYYEHPEFYFYRNGKPGNRVGDWSDIIDLDTSRNDTQDYLVSVLQYWVDQGFDGFRFDVASMIDFNVFKKARKQLGKKVIFLAESIDTEFGEYLRSQNEIATRDEDMYPVFDVLYNYSWYRSMEHMLKFGKDKHFMVEAMNKDKEILPKGYLRTNCLENHDCDRIASLLKDKEQLIEFTKFSYFLKGCPFIYAGQEYGNAHKPELFEKDPVNWSAKDEEILQLHKKLIKEKHQAIVPDDHFCEIDGENLIVKLYKDNKLLEQRSFRLFK